VQGLGEEGKWGKRYLRVLAGKNGNKLRKGKNEEDEYKVCEC
jgi:hypothetical protein